MQFNFKLKRKQRGQGMMEYVIIVALIAVAAIGVYSTFGQTVRNQTAGLAKEISGNDAKDQVAAAGKASGDSATRADKVKGMSAYNKENDQSAGAAGGGGAGGGGAGGGGAGG
ncbi:Flp family type IVb pilin [Massilia sp. Leaf139]|uniref:Flp family type IVb pilin n=1 Tax=Massilia sp. Leaf139 TaxID=1736272 RepID=UPI0006F2F7FD|nr:Flp family type IVb pilin [Massilia sp. Leaf139]KQQ91782.1 pilus assembly protein [Massilia sp. Leaf139]